MSSARFVIVFVVLTLAVASSCRKKEAAPHVLPPDAVMLPSSTDTIRGVFERLKPALVYESVSIDRDHVLGHVCGADKSAESCFDVRLDPPRIPCAGKISGPFCVSFPSGSASPAARDAMEQSTAQADWAMVWSAAEKHDPTTWQDRAREKLRDFGASVLTPDRLGLLLLFVMGLLYVRLRNRATPTRGQVVDGATAIAVAVITFFWLSRLNRCNEGNEVFLTAIECLTAGECYTVGPGSSIHFYNGAIWPELLLVLKMVGGTASDAHNLALAMMATGVGILFLVVSHFARPAVAVPSAILALALLGARPLVVPVLDNSVTVLSCFGVALSLYVFVMTERPLMLVLAGMFEAHAFNTHVSAISLLPAVFFVPAIAGRPPLRALGLTCLGFFGASFFTSAAELAGNAVMMFHAGLLFPALGAGLAAIAVGLWLNRRYQKLSVQGRLLVVGACLLAPHAAGVLTLRIIEHPVMPGYLPPVVAPLALLGGLLLDGLLTRLSAPRLRILIPLVASLIALNATRTPRAPTAFGPPFKMWNT